MGGVVTRNKTRVYCMKIDPETDKALRLLAQSQDRKRAAVIKHLIRREAAYLTAGESVEVNQDEGKS
jgi:hypothetical protein